MLSLEQMNIYDALVLSGAGKPDYLASRRVNGARRSGPRTHSWAHLANVGLASGSRGRARCSENSTGTAPLPLGAPSAALAISLLFLCFICQDSTSPSRRRRDAGTAARNSSSKRHYHHLN